MRGKGGGEIYHDIAKGAVQVLFLAKQKMKACTMKCNSKMWTPQLPIFFPTLSRLPSNALWRTCGLGELAKQKCFSPALQDTHK